MTIKPTTFWKYRQRKRLAKLAGITTQNLSMILHRERRVSQGRARLLETCSAEVLEDLIPWTEWLCNETTAHPAFFGSPKQLKTGS